MRPRKSPGAVAGNRSSAACVIGSPQRCAPMSVPDESLMPSRANYLAASYVEPLQARCGLLASARSRT